MHEFAISPGGFSRARTLSHVMARVRPATRKTFVALAVAATAGSVGLALPSAASAATTGPPAPGAVAGGYQQTAILHPAVTPTHGLFGDIVYADQQTHRLYFADTSSAAVDVWDTQTNHFLGAMTGGFTGLAGFPASFDHLGPDGVLVDNLGQIWAGNGDGTVKVGDTTTLAETDSIPASSIPATGQTARADEVGYDPQDHVIVVTNPGDTTPEVTLINAVNHHVLGHVAIPGAGPNTIEQPQWDPITERFLVAVIATSANPNGEIAVIDPQAVSLDKVLPLAQSCGPAGLTIGPGHDALIGCSAAGPIIIDRVTGTVRATLPQASGADEVWYDASDGRYYAAEAGNQTNNTPDPVVMVINARDRTFITNIPIRAQDGTPTAGFHAVTAAAGNVYVPESDGIHVFAQTPAPAPSADLKITVSAPTPTTSGTYSAAVTITNSGPTAATAVFTGLFASDGLTITATPGGEVFFFGRTAGYIAPTIAAGHTITYSVSVTAHPGAHGVHYLAAATGTLQTPDPNYLDNITATPVLLP